jgi:CMP-N,N'-diacetyllegionaminic acid synthase
MICVVPARKGSKGLKNKNIAKLNNIPLILHTIKTAQKSKKISTILLSTDDERIIKLCKHEDKLLILFKRPKKLSRDNSSSIDVYLHAIKMYEKLKKKKVIDFCAMLPTHPIRSYKEIDEGIKMFYKKKAKYLITVKELSPLNFQFRIKNNKIWPYKKIKMSVQNRQKLHRNFSPNGSLYVFNHKALKASRTFMTKDTYAFLQTKTPSFDIDTLEDLNLVKKYLEK